jgi:hypothetical protein
MAMTAQAMAMRNNNAFFMILFFLLFAVDESTAAFPVLQPG